MSTMELVYRILRGCAYDVAFGVCGVWLYA